MAERIHWNDDEKQLLAAESFRIIQKETALSPLAAVSRAQQKVLPENRRRDLHQNRSLNWLAPMWDQMRARDAALARRALARTNAESLFMPLCDAAPSAPEAVAPVSVSEPVSGTPPTDGNPPMTEPDDARPSSSEAASETENTQTASNRARQFSGVTTKNRKFALALAPICCVGPT